jgi:hypothetical protein
MGPYNRMLSAKADALASTSLEDTAAEAGVRRAETVHSLVDTWATLNLVRAIITGVAAVTATWASLNSVEVIGFDKIQLVSGANRI